MNLRKNPKTANHNMRKRLFEAYASQIVAISRFEKSFEPIVGLFLCPFCRRTFSKEALLYPPQLTLEHCIPQSLGGTLSTATLVCKDCNNGMGSTIDSHLKKKLDADDFLNGKSDLSRRCSINLGGGNVRADFEIRTVNEIPEMTFVFDDKRSDPNQYQKAISYLHNNHGSTFSFQFDVSLNYKTRNSRVSLLRIAYLMMFRQFGYPYVFHPNLEHVRLQLSQPENAILEEIATITIPQQPPFFNSVGIATQKSGERSFIVIIALKNEKKTIFQGILMPGIDATGSHMFSNAFKARTKGEMFEAKVDMFGYDPRRISDESQILYLLHAWRGEM